MDLTVFNPLIPITMRSLIDLEPELQDLIASRFVLPDCLENVVVDQYDRPFRKDGGLFMCAMRSSFVQGSFHKHELKNR